jgi:hypothetical protein
MVVLAASRVDGQTCFFRSLISLKSCVCLFFLFVLGAWGLWRYGLGIVLGCPGPLLSLDRPKGPITLVGAARRLLWCSSTKYVRPTD